MSEQFRKKKQYGQNFLTNPAIPQRIVKESGIDKTCGVLEIGPGLGALTLQLAPVAAKIVAVEIDHDLIEPLNALFDPYDHITLVENDILKVNLDGLLREHFADMPVCDCAKLPYYITTPILMKLLEGKHGFRSITVMVQKEVAERLCAKSGQDGYGAITASIGYYASVKRLFTVTAGNFSPKPKVDSAVIRFDLYNSPPFEVYNETLFFDVIKAAFLQRRKTLSNALASFFPLLTKEEIGDLLECLGLRKDARGEMLTSEQFALVANEIEKKKRK